MNTPAPKSSHLPKHKRRRIGFSLMLVLLVCCLQTASACKCEDHPPLTKIQCNPYDLIFEGTVDSVSGNKETFGFVYFSSSALYKGSLPDHGMIRFDASSDCAMSFQKGETWIVYAQYYKYALAGVDFCSRSRKKFTTGDDYYAALNGMTFLDEEQFLLKTFGVHASGTQTKSEMPARVLIQPTAYWKLWLLLISVAVMFLINYIVKKLP